jgi:hypothetical protein
LPSPSWPIVPFPQQYAVPATVTPHVWNPAVLVLMVPKSRPFAATAGIVPQQYALPPTLTAHVEKKPALTDSKVSWDNTATGSYL